MDGQPGQGLGRPYQHFLQRRGNDQGHEEEPWEVLDVEHQRRLAVTMPVTTTGEADRRRQHQREREAAS